MSEPRAPEPAAGGVATLDANAAADADADATASAAAPDAPAHADATPDADAPADVDATADPDLDADATPDRGATPDADVDVDADEGAGPAAAELATLLEALLFVSDGPIAERTLARVLEVTPRRVVDALDALGEALGDAAAARGLRLQRGPEGAQLVTAPEAAAAVEALLGLEGGRRLSAAAMETLAIVAYRQPVTRGQIERIRGVSSDAAIATLRARELITAVGRAPGPGRPTLFGTTQRFLGQFGLEHPRQLPPLPPDIAPLAEAVVSQLALPDAGAPADGGAGGGAGEALDVPPAAGSPPPPPPLAAAAPPTAEADAAPPDSIPELRAPPGFDAATPPLG